MLGAQNGCLPRNRRIARAMNPLFSICADAEIPYGLKALDNPSKVSLAWRFWPFANPCKWRSILVAFDRDQSFQPCNCLVFQPFGKVFVRLFPDASAGSQTDAFQYRRGGQ